MVCIQKVIMLLIDPPPPPASCWGVHNEVWGHYTSWIYQSCDVSFSYHVLLRLMILTRQSPLSRSGATKSVLAYH